jgi:hypothetical protein
MERTRLEAAARWRVMPALEVSLDVHNLDRRLALSNVRGAWAMNVALTLCNANAWLVST